MPTDEYQQTRNLIIEMRKYVVFHGLLIGECVAWNKLKEMYRVGDDGLLVDDRTFPCGHTPEDCDCDPSEEDERHAEMEERFFDGEPE